MIIKVIMISYIYDRILEKATNLYFLEYINYAEFYIFALSYRMNPF